MNDPMNELVQHSPYEGDLFLQPVSGDISGRREAENDADAGSGAARTMYAYAPKSGCPHPKQCQILMVLRNEIGKSSAMQLMKAWGLDVLAEEKNFLLLFPNPVGEGWNYQNDPCRENDMDYLIRCFGILKGSELGVSGFNGMVFYLAASPEASALLMTMSALKPLNVPAMMIGPFPKDYSIPQEALYVETAAFISCNPMAKEYLTAANRCSEQNGQNANPNVRLLETDQDIGADTVRLAWDRLFSETRRWQNDTYGCYQKRTNFTERGFIAHVRDSSLGCNNGFAHTWYEYIPPRLRGAVEKVPLLFYFHGGGCVPLYGAEQSGWHDVADRENFIVVYPEASQENCWNVWNDRSSQNGRPLCSDRDFFLALIEHMKSVHPIDETRIYVSGFSMGGMMSNAMACALPEVVAAAAPCNAYNEGYFSSFNSFMNRMQGKPYNPADGTADSPMEMSATRREADARKAAYDYRMPVIQTAGLLDGAWPIVNAEDARLKTFDYWRTYNHIPTEPFTQDLSNESGITADETFCIGEDRRFLCHRWFTEDEGHAPLHQLLLVKRCPHALDIRTADILWDFLKRYSRSGDGSLKISY